MMDFLFGSWPNGTGPLIVQLLLVIAGVAAGIRAVDDLKAWAASRRPATSDRRGD